MMPGIRVPHELQTSDPNILADRAGLEYVPDDAPGFSRRRRGSGFTFLSLDGTTITGAERRRVEDLAVPPAWTDVWIAPNANAHLLATGRDTEGRKQYQYHSGFSELTESLKFARLAYFGRALRRLRPFVIDELNQSEVGCEEYALAAATRLIDVGYLRVGNQIYRQSSGAQGATTLSDSEVDIGEDLDDPISLCFVGKGGKERNVEIEDPILNAALDELLDLPNDALFSYIGSEGPRSITSTQLNSYIAEVIGPAFTAKDFRTWGGTVTAARALLEGEDEVRAFDHAAEALGNTRAVARSSYVAPAILDAHESGQLQELWTSCRSSKWLDRSESCVEKVLRAN